MARESLLQIHRHEIACRVVEGSLQNSTEKNLQKNLLDIARQKLGPALEEALLPLDKADELLVFIEKVELNLDMDLSAAASQLARYWAMEIKKYLLEELGCGDGERLAVFKNEAVYRAQFIRDLMAGRAWSRWYYRRFEGLQALPLSAALRTLIVDEASQAHLFFDCFSAPELAELCSVFSTSDSVRVQQYCLSLYLSDKQKPVESRLITYLANILSSLDAVNIAGDKAQPLFLLIQGLREGDKNLASYALRFIELLVILKRKQQRANSRQFKRVCEALISKDIRTLKQFFNQQELIEMAPSLALPAAELALCVSALSADMPAATLSPRSITRFSYFGNALFFLQQLSELPWAALCDGWPDLQGSKASALLKHLAVCHCQGQEKCMTALKDPLLQDLAGLNGEGVQTLSLEKIQGWLSEISEECVHRAHLVLSSHLSKTVGAARQVLLNAESGLALLQVGSKKEIWLTLKRLTGEASIELELEQEDADFVQRAQTEFRYFEALNAYTAAEGMAELIACLAQYSLRSFAWRLPGFSQSSAKYLRQNFLGMSLTLVEEEQRYLAHLSRVPMSVILNMTGINRAVMKLPEFSEKALHLHEARI